MQAERDGPQLVYAQAECGVGVGPISNLLKNRFSFMAHCLFPSSGFLFLFCPLISSSSLQISLSFTIFTVIKHANRGFSNAGQPTLALPLGIFTLLAVAGLTSDWEMHGCFSPLSYVIVSTSSSGLYMQRNTARLTMDMNVSKLMGQRCCLVVCKFVHFANFADGICT